MSKKTRAEFTWPRRKIADMLLQATAQGVDEVNFVLQADLIEKLSQPGTGGGANWRPSKGQRYQPSAPGQPPAVQTGQLRLSWSAGKSGHYQTRIRGTEVESRYGQVQVGSALKYAAALEYGYPPRNLKARPYIRPVVDDLNKSGLPTRIVQRHVDEMLPLIDKLVPTQ